MPTFLWKRFFSLSRGDRAAVAQAILLLPLTALGLRLAGYRRWKGVLERLLVAAAPRRATGEEQLAEAARAARMVEAAERRGVVRPNCLERSLVLWWLLRRRGIAAELCIGARKREQRFEAHAWVECAGVVLNDTGEVHEHYSRFDAPIAAGAESP